MCVSTLTVIVTIPAGGALKHIWRAAQRAAQRATDSDSTRFVLLQTCLAEYKLSSEATEAMVQAVEEQERMKMAEMCMVCGKTRAELGMQALLKCSACSIEPKYCSAECQKVAWPSHKAGCKANRRSGNAVCPSVVKLRASLNHEMERLAREISETPPDATWSLGARIQQIKSYPQDLILCTKAAHSSTNCAISQMRGH